MLSIYPDYQFTPPVLSESDLLPEQPIVISPTLAATIGLDETVLLQRLSELSIHHGKLRPGIADLNWVRLEDRDFANSLPFWSAADIHRIRNSLEALGMIVIEQGATDSNYWLALAAAAPDNNTIHESQKVTSGAKAASLTAVTGSRPTGHPRSMAAPHSREAETAEIRYLDNTPHAGRMMRPDWQPDENWIRLCRQQAIPEAFIRERIPEFVTFWLERRQAKFSWGNSFYKWVIRAWREEQTRQGDLAAPMTKQWWPSPEAMEILQGAGINREFIEATVPEFVLYWRERRVEHTTWNSKFVQHIRQQWARSSDWFESDRTPRVIPDNWHPSKEFYDILELEEFGEEFVQSLIPEFVMYWKDRKEARVSWNTVFLRFNRMVWADRLNTRRGQENDHTQDQYTAGSTHEKVRARLEQLADRSWAD